MKRSQRSIVWGALLLIFLFLYMVYKFPSFQTQQFEILNNIFGKISSWIPNILLAIIIIMFTNFTINFTSYFITKYFEKKGKKEQDLFLILIVYRYLIWFLAVMISLSVLFKNFASLLTSLGLIGFGVTFALQKPILNFVGWLSIVANGPYKIGDRIIINDVKGDVFNIKVMYTYLREVNQGDSITGRVVSVPNEFVLTYSVTNYTRGTPYIWEEAIFAITYESNWKKAMKIVQEAAKEIVGPNMKKLADEWKKVQRKFDVGTNVVEEPSVSMQLADSWINLKVRYLVDVRAKTGIVTKLNTRVLEKIKNAKDVNLAYPHVQMIVENK